MKEWKISILVTCIDLDKFFLTSWTLFGTKYTSEEKLFKNLTKFDFESVCTQTETLKDTNETIWIGKLVPISITISESFLGEHIFLRNSDPHHLVASFFVSLEGLTLHSKTQIKLLFLDINATVKIKLGSILQKLTQRHNRREQVSLDDCDNKRCATTQFLKIQKSKLFDLWKHLERFCNVLPLFGSNNAKKSHFDQIPFATLSF